MSEVPIVRPRWWLGSRMQQDWHQKAPHPAAASREPVARLVVFIRRCMTLRSDMTDIRDPAAFYLETETASPMTPRLAAFAEFYRSHRRDLGRAANVLDVGCGRQALLSREMVHGDNYVGVDIVEKLDVDLTRYLSVDLNAASLLDELPREHFDIIFCGEVLEHLFSPDSLMDDLRKLVRTDGVVILSTPNLAYWANRLLLLAGISPLFLENSARFKLGRRMRALGQGSETQGHVRLFTHEALIEFLELSGFSILQVKPVVVWDNPVDRLVCHLSSRLAPDNVVVARRSEVRLPSAIRSSGRLGALQDRIRHRYSQDHRAC
jgi:2-polyprenyl-3-methyl-5-hydroxy-6-metoxy-1,4-benzoquinol methylase